MVATHDDTPRRHPRAGSEAAPIDEEHPDLSGLRILAVDDEPDARELVNRILSRSGAEVVTAGSGKDALQLLTQTRPHVLVMDIGMPDEDGYTVIRKIRQLPPASGGNVPALALTAFARSEDRRRAILAGFQMHIAKPVEPAELVALIASLALQERR